MVKRFLKVCAIAACVPAVALGASYLPGAGADFSYSNASDLNGGFGQPITSGVDNNIFFPFANFSASADGTNPNVSVTDTLTMDLLANAGLRFDSITLITNGTRTITGSPGVNSVQADGTIDVTGLTGDPFFGTDSYTFFDDQPAAGAAWSDSAMVTIPLGTQVTELNLLATQDLFAIAGDGTSQITATFEIVGVAVSLVPEPSAIALLGLGGLALLRRRR